MENLLENILPRKYNNSVTIGLACLLAISVAVIIYWYMKSETSTHPSPSQQPPPPSQTPQHQHTHEQHPGNLSKTRVGGGKPALVLIWASWCGHSTNMKPAWDKVAAILNDGGAIEAVDYEDKRDPSVIELATKKLPNFGGFPDIRFFPDGFDLDTNSIKFNAPRTEEEILKFAYASAGNK